LNGDVNKDGNIDIVDALLTAQYYVGLNPNHFDFMAADVDCNSAVTIIDALLIAQCYVGLIDSFPSCPTPTPTVTSAPTSVPTPTPTPDPPVCFVEPYAPFYKRLQGMCLKVSNALDNTDMMVIHGIKFQNIYDWSVLFEDFAQKQLDGTALTLEEYNQIHKFWKELETFFSTASFVPEADSKALVVSDIYTYEDAILHEAVGSLHPMIVVYPVPGGTEVLASVGYVLSYYEFPETGNMRLTDEEWEYRLNSMPPPKPVWTGSFME